MTTESNVLYYFNGNTDCDTCSSESAYYETDDHQAHPTCSCVSEPEKQTPDGNFIYENYRETRSNSIEEHEGSSVTNSTNSTQSMSVSVYHVFDNDESLPAAFDGHVSPGDIGDALDREADKTESVTLEPGETAVMVAIGKYIEVQCKIDEYNEKDGVKTFVRTVEGDLRALDEIDYELRN